MGILAAIAVPTFLGQRNASHDRAAQSSLLAATTVLQASAANTGLDHYPADNSDDLASTLSMFEPALTFQTIPSSGPNIVQTELVSRDSVILIARSDSGTCWFFYTHLAGVSLHGTTESPVWCTSS